MTGSGAGSDDCDVMELAERGLREGSLWPLLAEFEARPEQVRASLTVLAEADLDGFVELALRTWSVQSTPRGPVGRGPLSAAS